MLALWVPAAVLSSGSRRWHLPQGSVGGIDRDRGATGQSRGTYWERLDRVMRVNLQIKRDVQQYH